MAIESGEMQQNTCRNGHAFKSTAAPRGEQSYPCSCPGCAKEIVENIEAMLRTHR